MYKNTVIGDDEKKMEKVLSNLVQTMEDEQVLLLPIRKTMALMRIHRDAVLLDGWLGLQRNRR